MRTSGGAMLKMVCPASKAGYGSIGIVSSYRCVFKEELQRVSTGREEGAASINNRHSFVGV